MLREKPFIVGDMYHLYSRGVNKMPIFLSADDISRFVKMMYALNGTNGLRYNDVKDLSYEKISEMKGESIIDIGAWCLMDNHIHILAREKVHCGISKFMSKLMTSYAKYFNIKNERTGVLFESRFKSKRINDDLYMDYLFAYINLNPVKKNEPEWKEYGILNVEKSKNIMENYGRCSYHDYVIGGRVESLILNKDAFPEHWNGIKSFEAMAATFSTNINNQDLEDLELKKS
ncbi:transposase [Patescibacteria group bacterium]